MRQLLHLLVVHPERRAALATWRGTRWLLPMLCCHERARAESLMSRWLAGQALSGDVIGQWLGRMTSNADGIDWLAVISAAADPRTTPPSGLRWTPLEALRSSSALMDYQHWAVQKATQTSDLPAVNGPFGSLTWLDQVKKWLNDVAGLPDAGHVTPYRVSSHEVVLGIPTGRGRVYFKGLAPDRAIEATITSRLSALAPECFARTVALETRADGVVWWLADACPGLPLTQCLFGDTASRVACACADVQRRVTAMAGGGALELPKLSLSTAAAWSIRLLEASDLPEENVAACAAAIERACRRVSLADVPQSWIPLDLDPENVLLDDRGAVRFIDLDDSFLGAAPLAIATFASRTSRVQIDRGCNLASKASLYRAYERAWLTAKFGGCDWTSFEIVSAVLEAFLGWTRIVRNTGRGEVHGVLHLAAARIAQRLARSAITRHDRLT
jgi:hypothetical protein